MKQIAPFHSALGVRPGVTDAAARLRDAGHDVAVIDYYGEGRQFDEYAAASAYVDGVGFPELMRRALAGCDPLRDGFIAMGFSNGGGMAEHVALNRSVAGVVMASGALPIAALGAEHWPECVAAQLHYMADDPFRSQASIDALSASVRATATLDLHADYPGSGHLFTDSSLPEEYDERAATLFWTRVLDFCSRTPRGAVDAVEGSSGSGDDGS